MPRLMIVDDEVAQQRALCDTLTQEGFTATGFTSPTAALASLRAGEFDLVLTDLMMPEMDGIALLEAIRAVDPAIVGVVMTGHGTVDTAVKAMQAGALDYVLKPFRLNAVLPVLHRALAIRELRRANAELEQRIRERTEELEVANRELEAANADLESFSFSVSHDLRAPLRAVSSFIEMFFEDHGAILPEDGRAQLQHVRNGAERMGILIEDLLRFSRFSRQRLSMRLVDVRTMVSRIVAERRAQEPNREVEVRIGELPACQGDPSLLEQVFVNLLSNAFKFTRDRRPAHIEVSYRLEPGAVVYVVRDNGAGFDMKYADKLFGVFQRLHTVDEFDGTGVGLSIVQRIVQRHGGHIRAEGQVNQGVAFHVSLPLPAPWLPAAGGVSRPTIRCSDRRKGPPGRSTSVARRVGAAARSRLRKHRGRRKHVIVSTTGDGGFAQQQRALIRRHRVREQVPLAERATEVLEDLRLLVALDPLGDNLDVQVPRDRNDRTHDCEITRIRHEVADEASIDLERVDVPVLQVAQT